MTFAHWISAFANHLWQSTAFAAMAWLLALALQKNQARARHWIWLGASIKFLVPFSLLFAVGSHLRPAVAPPIMRADVSTQMTQIAQPFLVEAPIGLFVASVAGTEGPTNLAPAILIAIWALGFAGVAFCWWLKWRRMRNAVRLASPVTLAADVPVMSSASLLEPGIFGILRPVLMLPAGILERLKTEQLDAIIAHEMCHVRRRDNLAAAIHMLVESVFWFNPMVWWIGSRLVEERERACDEEVLRLGSEREAYAEGILNVCKYYVESPLACVSGISGSDLKTRIVRIMTQRPGANLTFARRLLLNAVAFAAIAGPLAFGIMNAPLLRAQATQDAQTQDPNAPLPSFEVASIKEDHSDGRSRLFQNPGPGRFHTINIRAKDMIQFAYGIKDFQLSGGPSWIDAQGYVIDAKADDATTAQMQKLPRQEQMAQMRLMLRSLLADRFKLQVSHAIKELPIFALVVAKGGPRLTPTAWVEPDPSAPKPATPPQNGPHLMLSRDKISAVNQPISGLADLLAVMQDLGGRLVVDQTGIKGNYDFELRFTSEGPAKNPAESTPADDSGPSIFTALEEQMGLRLESTKGPVETYTIEHIEQPSEN